MQIRQIYFMGFVNMHFHTVLNLHEMGENF